YWKSEGIVTGALAHVRGFTFISRDSDVILLAALGNNNEIHHLTLHIVESEKMVGIEGKGAFCVLGYHVHPTVIAVQLHFQTRFGEDSPSGSSIHWECVLPPDCRQEADKPRRNVSGKYSVEYYIEEQGEIEPPHVEHCVDIEGLEGCKF
ncbi:hypothetical protein C0J52_12022, partial [Blattella germanica]